MDLFDAILVVMLVVLGIAAYIGNQIRKGD